MSSYYYIILQRLTNVNELRVIRWVKSSCQKSHKTARAVETFMRTFFCKGPHA